MVKKSWCKECRREYNRERYKNLPEEKKQEYRKRSYEKHREKRLKWQKEHYDSEKAKRKYKEWFKELKKHPQEYEEWKKKQREQMKKYRKEHPEIVKKRSKQQLKKLHKRRLLCLEHYGGKPPKCAICGYDDVRALTIDHINGGGTQHRRKIKRWGTSFSGWLVKNNFPEGFQVLCRNCNWVNRLKGK